MQKMIINFIIHFTSKMDEFITAAREGNLKKIQEFLQAGVDPNQKVKGWTALMVATRQGHFEIVKLLLDYGADPDIQFSSKNPEARSLAFALDKNHIDIVKLLLDYGADPNIRDWRGRSLIMSWTLYNNPGIIKLLIESGADLNIRDKEGKTILMETSEAGMLNLVKITLEEGANPNIQDEYGRTALMRVADSEGSHDIVKLLLEAGANPDILTRDEDSALDIALQYEIIGNIKLLLDAGADPNTNSVQYRLKTDIDERLTNHYSRIDNHLIQFKYDPVDPNKSDYNGVTNLMIASQQPSYPAYRIHALLRRGGDVNIQDKDGNTAFHYAVNSGDYWKVRALLDAKSDPYVKNNDKIAPFQYGLESNNPKIQKLFKVYWSFSSLQHYFGVQRNIMEIIRDYYDKIKPFQYGLESSDPEVRNLFKVYWAYSSLQHNFRVPRDIMNIIREYHNK